MSEYRRYISNRGANIATWDILRSTSLQIHSAWIYCERTSRCCRENVSAAECEILYEVLCASRQTQDISWHAERVGDTVSTARTKRVLSLSRTFICSWNGRGLRANQRHGELLSELPNSRKRVRDFIWLNNARFNWLLSPRIPHTDRPES